MTMLQIGSRNGNSSTGVAEQHELGSRRRVATRFGERRRRPVGDGSGGSVALRVADLNRAVHFYTELLGFDLKLRVGDFWAEVEATGLTVGLLVTECAEAVGDGGPAIGLTVDDLYVTRTRLVRQGVVFLDDRQEDGTVRIATFRDPDGNPVYLCEVIQGPGAHLIPSASW